MLHSLTNNAKLVTRFKRTLFWLTNDNRFYSANKIQNNDVDPLRLIPFLLMHVGCVGILFVGTSTAALVLASILYVLRMFFITAFYHRYFSHRAFECSRKFQAVMAIVGCTAGQRGPLWWASHHRSHHLHSDTNKDPHSPSQTGFWFSHSLWFLTPKTYLTPENHIKDWLIFPELKWIDKTDWLPFVGLAGICYALGSLLNTFFPGLETSGAQCLVWGFFVSTTCLYHATYAINSLGHLWGTRRFGTRDNSRNNSILALITLGEGWHNNHHRYPRSARHGLYWWECDIAYLGIMLMSAVGLVWNVQKAPSSLTAKNQDST